MRRAPTEVATPIEVADRSQGCDRASEIAVQSRRSRDSLIAVPHSGHV